jgi:hypothetical protein
MFITSSLKIKALACKYDRRIAMRIRLIHQISFALVALLFTGLCLVNVEAQQRRKRSRRITNPVINTPAAQPGARPSPTPASPNDASIISTAEDQDATDATAQPAPTPARRTTRTRTPATTTESDPEGTRRTINRLSTQVTILSTKLSEMEQQQRTLVDLERLSRAETRAEGLRAQLRDVEEKRGNLEARAEQIEYEIKPENIERSVSTYGSTHPEELREMRRRQLESEQRRVLSQLTTFRTSESRLASAIATADADADRIRARIDAVSDTQQGTEANTNSNNTETPANDSPATTAPSTDTRRTTTTPAPPDASQPGTPR